MLDCDRRLMIVPLYVRVARKRAGEKLVSTQPNVQYREHPDYADSEIHRSIRKSFPSAFSFSLCPSRRSHSAASL